MTRLARVLLTGTRIDGDLDPITLDVFLDDTRRVVHRFPTCGWWGKLKGTEDLMPFILFPDGRMDFGTGFEEHDRYHRTNVQSKRLDVGEYVTVTHESGEHCFVVKQVLWVDEVG